MIFRRKHWTDQTKYRHVRMYMKYRRILYIIRIFLREDSIMKKNVKKNVYTYKILLYSKN